jgi:hypothetical protein
MDLARFMPDGLARLPTRTLRILAWPIIRATLNHPDAGHATPGYALMRIQSDPKQDYASLAMKGKVRKEEDL